MNITFKTKIKSNALALYPFSYASFCRGQQNRNKEQILAKLNNYQNRDFKLLTCFIYTLASCGVARFNLHTNL